MSMITCEECGKEFSEKAPACPNCGHPNPNAKTEESTVVQVVKPKGFWSAGRLAIGVISIVLFFVITFQSCAAGLVNTIEENGSNSGTMGFALAFMMMIAGIVGICTRNSESKIGAIISCVLYVIGAICSFGNGDTYGDLPIWGTIALIFAVVFLISAIKTKKKA